MSENLHISSSTKAEKYQELIPQLKALLTDERDEIANLANCAAALKQTFDFFWVGFYLVKDDELVLGPFQGPIACTRIKKGKGVCGTSWEKAKSILVADVEQFPDHIACSSLSKSEIVIPLIKSNHVIGVLDVDSDSINDFDEVDEKYLTELCAWLANII